VVAVWKFFPFLTYREYLDEMYHSLKRKTDQNKTKYIIVIKQQFPNYFNSYGFLIMRLIPLSSNCKPYRIFIPLLLISVDFIVKG
jgi:hypothetical protein